MEKVEGTGERVGDYRVVRRLATGGTSDVLLAQRDVPGSPDDLVVLKVLLTKYERDANLKAMFTREAAVYARLRHPSIVGIHDYFPNGERLVMVLEYVDGPPLGRLRGMLKTVGQPMDDVAALHLGACVFDALAAAHAAVDDDGESAPVVHRDVNPSNILVAWDGAVKLADFGVAKVLGSGEQTLAGSIKGTYGYMAPEQVRGEAVTPRADVYAAATVLWELLTKRRAFLRGALPELEVLRALADPHIVPLDVLRPDLDPRLREALKRALDPKVEKRTITAEELAGTLRAMVTMEQGQARLESLLSSVRHEPRSTQTSAPPPPLGDVPDEETAKFFGPRGTANYGAPPRPRFQSMSPDEIQTVMNRPSGTTKTAMVVDRAVPLATPLASAVAPGRALKESIDEILGDLSSRPGRGLDALRGPASSQPSQPDSEPSDQTVQRGPSGSEPTIDRTLPLGQFPGAPPALDPLRRDLNAPPLPPASRPPSIPADGSLRRPAMASSPELAKEDGEGAGSAGYPSSFPAMSRTLAMSFSPPAAAIVGRQPVPMSLPPLELPPETAPLQQRSLAPRPVPRPGGTPPAPPVAPKPTDTAPMPARPPSRPELRSAPAPLAPPPPPSPPEQTLALSTTKMPAYVQPPAPPPPPPPLPATGVQTSPRGEMVATLPLAPPPPESTDSAPPAHLASAPPSNRPRDPIPYQPMSDPPPPERRSPAGAILAVLLVALVIGGGGFGFARWRRAAITRSAPAAKALATVEALPTTTTTSAMPTASTPSEPPSASAAPPASASPAPSMTASSSASATPPPSAPAFIVPPPSTPSDVPSGMGRLKTAGDSPGHRIFVDDRTVGQTPDPVLVKCGVHKIRIGSAGPLQTIDVPCGAEISVGDR